MRKKKKFIEFKLNVSNLYLRKIVSSIFCKFKNFVFIFYDKYKLYEIFENNLIFWILCLYYWMEKV